MDSWMATTATTATVRAQEGTFQWVVFDNIYITICNGIEDAHARRFLCTKLCGSIQTKWYSSAHSALWSEYFSSAWKCARICRTRHMMGICITMTAEKEAKVGLVARIPVLHNEYSFVHSFML